MYNFVYLETNDYSHDNYYYLVIIYIAECKISKNKRHRIGVHSIITAYYCLNTIILFLKFCSSSSLNFIHLNYKTI